MYYLLNTDEYEKIKEAEKTTFTDYELKGNFISVESMMTIIEDLLLEIEHREEELEDIRQDIRDNYKHINYEEQL